ncbi:secretion protein HlyD family protein [Fulvivirga imtechensis AK7]|uniref:Secretion protein HlyD family protein n=1 Tax=Fulvivirga imtechensis AK7 TaxID=1237149 RepID=L8JNV2_9BACT|nr:HlyD family efflux transporter periplasmic adaptor subunit [Fulvivirga imtechensis]ELR69057.1 secretion protein HlyD family protein [Fulvivirga imtechensis AK7]
MSKKIFPAEILNFTIETQIAKNTVKSQAIYVTLLASLIIAIGLLPIIHIDVSVQNRGIIRPDSEVTQIMSPAQGKIDKLFFNENDMVLAGDTLLTINSSRVFNQLEYTKERLQELESYINDLDVLLQELSPSAFNPVSTLHTASYQRQYKEFKELINQANQVYIKKKRDYHRSKKLFEGEAISQVEFENSRFEFDRSLADFKALHLSQLTKWSDELQGYKNEREKITSEVNKIKEDQRDYVVIAPVSGSIQELRGLAVGVQIFPNQSLLKISPDSELVVETYISPSDIGLIKMDQKVNFQIDAFNYNQWGFASGAVKEIASDITIKDNQPFFRVICSMKETSLSLKNGYTGRLKKGMTLNSRFIIAKRSLWQLLYDKMDDWLNPNA